MTTLFDKAARFKALHAGPDVFLIANAWDAGSARLLAGRADAVLHGPRATLGPPWTKDHRVALAATIVAG